LIGSSILTKKPPEVLISEGFIVDRLLKFSDHLVQISDHFHEISDRSS